MKIFEAYAERQSDTDPYAPFTEPAARIHLQEGRSAWSGYNLTISPLAERRAKFTPRFTRGGLSSIKAAPHSRGERSQGLLEMLQELGAARLESDPYTEISQSHRRVTAKIVEGRLGRVVGKPGWSRSQRAPEEKTPLDEFLQPVMQLEKGGHTDAALDVLYDRVDDLLKAKQFAAMDALLEQANVESISVDILLGLLTASLPARSKLRARAKFYAAVEASIKRRGEWEDGLLAGLES